MQFGAIGQSSAIRQRNLNVNLSAAVCSVTSYLLHSVVSLSLYQSIVIMETPLENTSVEYRIGHIPPLNRYY